MSRQEIINARKAIEYAYKVGDANGDKLNRDLWILFDGILEEYDRKNFPEEVKAENDDLESFTKMMSEEIGMEYKDNDYDELRHEEEKDRKNYEEMRKKFIERT